MTTPSIQELRREYIRRHGRSSWGPRLVITLVGLTAVVALIGFFVVPPVAKAQLQKRLGAALHRKVTVGKVQFNPFTLSATLTDFSIQDRDGSPFVSWQRLFVNFEAISIFRSEWRFQEIALEGFRGRALVGKDGRLNFADVLEPDTHAAPAEKNAAPPRPLHVDKLAVTDAHLDYTDESLLTPFSTQVGPLTFTLTNFHTAGGADAPGEFTATTESGETILWKGALALAPLRSNGAFTLGKIALKKYMPYYAPRIGFAVRDGLVDVSGHYELEVKNGQLALRLTEGAVKVSGLKIAQPGAVGNAVALDLVEVGGLSADSMQPSVDAKIITVSGGEITAVRTAQGIDLANLFAPSPPAVSNNSLPASTAPSAASAHPLQARVEQIGVQDLSVVLDDRSNSRPVVHTFEHVTASAKNFSLAEPAKPVLVEAHAESPTDGTLSLSGNVALDPFNASVAVELKNTQLAPLSPYLEPFASVRFGTGQFNATGKVQASAASGGALTLAGSGELSVSDFSVQNSVSGDEFASWKNLTVKGIEYSSSPARLTVAEVNLGDPSARVIVNPDHTLNLTSLMANGPATTTPAPAPTVSIKPPSSEPSAAGNSAPPLFVAIDKVAIERANLSLLDRSIEPNVDAAINQLTGTISGLSSANLARADVDLHGEVAGSAPVSITGQINPLSGDAFTDLKVEFKKVELVPFAPYISRYAGHELQRGSLTLDVKWRLGQRRLESNNVVTLDQFTLGAPTNSPDAPKLPISLALALLRDTHGQIVIDVPVQGSLDDPNFRIGRVVGRILLNLLTKAATSPFSLIGSMFGGGSHGDDLAFQTFPPGQSALGDEDAHKLDVVAKALRERPALRLDIEGGYDPAADVPAMRDREFEKRIRTALWEENHRYDPNVGPADTYVVTPQGAARMTAVFYREALGQAHGESAPPAAAATPPPPPPRRWFLFRLFHRTPAQPKPQPQAKPAAAPPEEPLPSLAEMRTKLIDAIDVDDNALKQLAEDRAERVKDYLVGQGEVPADRVSLIAVSADANKKGPRVSLHLK